MRQVLKYFDKWNDAVKEADLHPLDVRGRPDKVRGLQKEQLIARMKEVAKRTGVDYLKLQDFKKSMGITDRPIYRLFPGGWIEALRVAGLKPHPRYNLIIPIEELFKEYFRVTEQLTRYPSYPEFARRSKYSIGVYAHRFGNFTEFRKHAMQYGIDNGLVKPELAQPAIESLQAKSTHKEPAYKILDGRPVLGEKIDFQGLTYAPVNELGVVYLFGILSKDLGFEVESVQSGFPDCAARRRIKNNKWQKDRIEIEYRSSNFIEHRHDITKCDIIVCWENDLHNCPLEIIPLLEDVAGIHK